MEQAFSDVKEFLEQTSEVSSSVDDIPVEYTLGAHDGVQRSLKGGSSLEGGNSPLGTAGSVCYYDSCDPVLITSYHVSKDGPSNTSTGNWVEWQSHKLENVASASQEGVNGQDVIAFYLADLNADEYDVLGTHDRIPDVNGYWTFEGLSEDTTGSSIDPTYTYGAKSGNSEGVIEKTGSGESLDSAGTNRQN